MKSTTDPASMDRSERQRVARAYPHPKRRQSESESQHNLTFDTTVSLAAATIEPTVGSLPSVNAATPDFMQLDFFDPPKTNGLDCEQDSMDWFSVDLDVGFWPPTLDLQAENQFLQDICSAVPPVSNAYQDVPYTSTCTAPTAGSDIADLLKNTHAPVLDKDAVDVRQYVPTSIEVDAPLSFPNIETSSLRQAGLEDFAHVDALSADKLDAVHQLLNDVQTKPHYPLFDNINMPPPAILNAWVQLYFEYFHPTFPVLHKATFASPETQPLLILTVAAIGAQFSNLSNSLACARSLTELVRRISSRECEFQNKHGRTVWMTQVVMLNALARSYSGEKRALEVSEILQAVPVALARRKGLLDDVLTHERMSQLQAPLHQTWRLWIMEEERRRTGFAVWLVDSAFRSNFNLTTVMDARELRNSLPQAEQRWSANSAQSWASYPPGLGSGRTQYLAQVIDNDEYISTWLKTGTLGKFVLLQDLMDRVRPTRSNSQALSAPSSEGAHAEQVLKDILLLLQQEQDTPVEDLRALTAQQATCLAALMTSSGPTMDLTTVALNQIYNRTTNQELSRIAQAWREAPCQGREAVAHAAHLFELIRNNHTTHFSMPSYLLNAVLVLWSYSFLFENPEVTDFAIEQDLQTSVALGTTTVGSLQVQQWISDARGRVKLPSIASLLSRQGRRKLLEHAMVVMGSLKSWGISKSYLQLLKRLQASEIIS
ncbi:DNA binding [Ascochyta rabiei]|uniref:DNA binding n=1 Tax=Didymella rabiei TaxID=5454 RepID=A0A163M2B1_DIDRA|nr:DNA binding [Ascochyta rabiei]